MNRSVRNGIAIAGMAGGLFFLGQAVASASDQVANAGNGTTQTNTATDGGGSGANHNETDASAKNVDVTKVESTVTGGSGGINNASVNTGVISGPPNVVYSTSTFQPSGDGHEKSFTSVTFNSGDVSLTQNANGGAVSGSGNVAVADTGGSQTATATNTVNQSNTSSGDEHKGREHHDGNNNQPASLSQNTGPGGDEHHSDGNANKNESDATATNIHKVEVDTTVTGGDGGINNAEINTGIIGNTFYCPEKTSCTFNFHTGNVSLVQNANGGAVSNSGNVGVGAPVPGACECPKPVVKSDCPESAAPAAVVRPAVKAAAALSSAQPSGQLAFTGSDVSLPLTVGLLTLVAGLGLTVLGRRRETQTV